MLKRIEGLVKRVVECLEIEMISTLFDDTIVGNSPLMTRPIIKVVINESTEGIISQKHNDIYI